MSALHVTVRFYTGTLELPPINGPTEGILIGVFVQFLTAIMGTPERKGQM